MNLNEYKGNYLINFISNYYIYILLLMILLGYCTAYLIGRLDPPLMITSLLIVLPILVATSILHMNRYDHPYSFLNDKDAIIDIPGIYLKILFTTIYLITIIILASSPTRPRFYFVLITILYLLIFIQILCDSSKPSIILIQIMLILLNFCYGLTLKYPYYFGMTDYIGHIFMGDFIIKTGHTIPESIEMTYAHFPLYHIIMAISSIFTGLSVQVTTFLVSNFVFCITILFVYLFAHLITKNQRLSLLSAFFYASFHVVIFYSHYMVTRSMAFVGFIMLLYLIIKINRKERNSNSLKIISIISTFFILVVHQVSLPQYIFLLFILFFCIFLVTNTINNLVFFSFMIISFLTYWIYLSWDFLHLLIKTRTASQYYDAIILVHDKSELVDSSWIINSLVYILSNVHMLIFILFAIMGIGLFLKQKQNPYLTICALFSLIVLIFFIPNPLVNLWVFQWLFRADRFSLMVAPFMAIIMGTGVWYIMGRYNYKSTKKFLTILICFIICISVYSSVTMTLNAGDSSDLHPTFMTPYFSSNELSTFNFLLKNGKDGTPIFSDNYVRRYFELYEQEASDYGYPFFWLPDVPPIDDLDISGLFIYRKNYYLKKSHLSFYHFLYLYTLENLILLERNLNIGDKVYSNEYNEIYMFL